VDDLTQVRLRDGTEAFVVPLLPANREALRQEYEHLSAETRFDRFLSVVPELTDTMLDHLVDEVDGVDHVALVLLVLTSDGTELPLGLARIIRYPDDPTIADIAVTVVDDWHGRGVATALLEVLIRHRPQGVERIVTVLSASNRASLAMLRRLGEVVVSPPESGVQLVVVDLPDSADSTPPERGHVDTSIQTGRGSPLRRHDPTEPPASRAPTT
jgi:RimJ/RimL family protein N-acetyltransferase